MRPAVEGRRWRFWKTLSGRFLLLTVVFVLLAETLVFLPSIARYRYDRMDERLKLAQVAALTQLASDNMVSPDLEAELLANAAVFNVVLRRDDVRQLVLSSPVPGPVAANYDLRKATSWELIRDALALLAKAEVQVIRVIGHPVQEGGQLIEITMDTKVLRQQLLEFSFRILALSALISAVMAVLLFTAAQRLLVAPIRRVVRHMQAYAEAPEDARRVIAPTAEVMELRAAEEAMAQMQTQLIGAFKQKERLAQLGGAVAKISHDLRNILTTAQLFADRLEGSADPAVARSAPKLINSISRAVALCESTLVFGKAEEAPPKLRHFALAPLVAEVAEGEGLPISGLRGASAGEDAPAEALVSALLDVPAGLMLRADPEQLHRVLSNLLRNARQAIEATGQPGMIEISAGEDDNDWWIRVGDTGPGLPAKAREHLFAAFQGGARKGGTGLGLAIAAELVRGHGGRLELHRSDSEGSEFVIHLPKAEGVAEA
ncbi:HAMP domain-containing sensor histidine kinase [Xinfangfangia sp. CPCC 101601]|uniref:histidine kinase n=1 Tax=Pseudogemmobacter lacusdianii TaxID=3069608 RepID=A0ABU0W0H2_9RHOB|nr:HAMP domain-containing sensor histidine kinase [Xinfangfangia sp. CPCC 101601]MDQ2067472.1 HAMP domain-containing sensor histidine kinase [Xinfangfangia sp. CPCC 101601]